MSEEPTSDTTHGYYVYLLNCANDTLYVGYTQNVDKRIAQHNAGRGGRYTRKNRPVFLVASWSFSSKGEALKAERILKRLPPRRKLQLAESQTLWQEPENE